MLDVRVQMSPHPICPLPEYPPTVGWGRYGQQEAAVLMKAAAWPPNPLGADPAFGGNPPFFFLTAAPRRRQR